MIKPEEGCRNLWLCSRLGMYVGSIPHSCWHLKWEQFWGDWDFRSVESDTLACAVLLSLGPGHMWNEMKIGCGPGWPTLPSFALCSGIELLGAKNSNYNLAILVYTRQIRKIGYVLFICFLAWFILQWGFPGGTNGTEAACQRRRWKTCSSIPGSERSMEKGMKTD